MRTFSGAGGERRHFLKKMQRLYVVLAILIVSQWATVGFAKAEAEVDWTLEKQMDVEDVPLDVASSTDGQMIFILVPQKILVYSVPENRIINRIPLEEAFDRLTYSTRDNSLILSGSVSKKVMFISLEMVYDIPVSDLPFKGPENAPVTIAVFNDYQ
jgi:hypothetical protein